MQPMDTAGIQLAPAAMNAHRFNIPISDIDVISGALVEIVGVSKMESAKEDKAEPTSINPKNPITNQHARR